MIKNEQYPSLKRLLVGLGFLMSSGMFMSNMACAAIDFHHGGEGSHHGQHDDMNQQEQQQNKDSHNHESRHAANPPPVTAAPPQYSHGITQAPAYHHQRSEGMMPQANMYKNSHNHESRHAANPPPVTAAPPQYSHGITQAPAYHPQANMYSHHNHSMTQVENNHYQHQQFNQHSSPIRMPNNHHPQYSMHESHHTNGQQNIHVKHYDRPSHLTNHYTSRHLNQAVIWNKSFSHNHKNSGMVLSLNHYRNDYHHRYYPATYHSYHVYNSYWHNPHFHNWYRPWYQHGFYGGFWYPVRPVFYIENYFSYPVVQWFYVEEPPTVEYYSSYYPDEPLPPQWCMAPFPYKQVYFPTDTFRDLLVEASAYPQLLRCNFRVAIVNFTQQLRDVISAHYSLNGFQYRHDDIVINYYQNLQNEAIVVAGFINHGSVHAAFEGLLDINNPNNTVVFSPAGQIPTQVQLRELELLNNRIISLGGDPFTREQQPETASQDLSPGPA